MIGLVLTYNEEQHIKRCLESLSSVCSHIYVIDSYSDDKTIEICKLFKNITILQNSFTTHSQQIRWGLDKITFNDNWVLRLDADEYLDNKLIMSLKKFKPSNYKGFKINRTIFFDGKPVLKGGQFPIKILRLFHKQFATIDSRPMDEHFKVNGKVSRIKYGNIVDDNKNNIDWWFDKHLHYAKIEALIRFSGYSEGPGNNLNRGIYYMAPIKFSSLFLFSYRFFFRLGFTGSKENIFFLIFQTLWYRTLVSYYLNRLQKVKDVLASTDSSQIIGKEFGSRYKRIFEGLSVE